MEKEEAFKQFKPNSSQSDLILKECRDRIPYFDELPLEDKRILMNKYWEKLRSESFDRLSKDILVAAVLYNEGIRDSDLEKDTPVGELCNAFDNLEEGSKLDFTSIEEADFGFRLEGALGELYQFLTVEDYIDVSEDLKRFFVGLETYE